MQSFFLWHLCGEHSVDELKEMRADRPGIIEFSRTRKVPVPCENKTLYLRSMYVMVATGLATDIIPRLGSFRIQLE